VNELCGRCSGCSIELRDLCTQLAAAERERNHAMAVARADALDKRRADDRTHAALSENGQLRSLNRELAEMLRRLLDAHVLDVPERFQAIAIVDQAEALLARVNQGKTT
jgi:hypothetical protein